MRAKLIKQKKAGVIAIIIGVLISLGGYFMKQDAETKLMILNQGRLDQMMLK